MTHTELYALPNESATAQLAQRIAQQLRAGDVVFLMGDLGAGKTTFSRYVLRALGVTERVKSPTYTLVERYALPTDAVAQHAYHFDLYRLSEAREWFDAGFDEYLNPNSIALIEWAQRAQGALPSPQWLIELSHEPFESRQPNQDAQNEEQQRYARINQLS